MGDELTNVNDGESLNAPHDPATGRPPKKRRLLDASKPPIEQQRYSLRPRHQNHQSSFAPPDELTSGAETGSQHRATLSDIPQEIFEMIIARIPFDKTMFPNLRCVCRKFHHTIPLETPRPLFAKVAAQSYPLTHAALYAPETCDFVQLVTLRKHAMEAHYIINKVSAKMTDVDRSFESQDWKPIMLKGLLLWQRFTSSCTSHGLDPDSLLADQYCLSALSIKTHLLLRYVSAKLQRCLSVIFKQWNTQFGDILESDDVPDNVDDIVATAFGLVRPRLHQIGKMFLAISTGETDEDGGSGSLFYLYFDQFMRRIYHEIKPFHQYLESTRNWRPNIDNVVQWLCQQPPDARPVSTEDHRILRADQHYKVVERLVTKMLAIENITDGVEYLSFACHSLEDRVDEVRLESISGLLDIDSGLSFGPEDILDVLRQDCNPVQVLDANLLDAASQLRKSMANVDDIFEKAINEFNALDLWLDANAQTHLPSDAGRK